MNAWSPAPPAATAVWGAGRVQLARVGQVGVTTSPLRPGGKARFGDQILDVISQGELVASRPKVRIIGHSGSEAIVEVIELNMEAPCADGRSRNPSRAASLTSPFSASGPDPGADPGGGMSPRLNLDSRSRMMARNFSACSGVSSSRISRSICLNSEWIRGPSCQRQLSPAREPGEQSPQCVHAERCQAELILEPAT
jgi:hypothetical protein